jgi:hypothetical protein
MSNELQTGPEYLYRITYRNVVDFDEESYLLPHFRSTRDHPRSVPLAEEGDLEVIARFFVYAKLLNHDQPFLVLKILAQDIINKSSAYRSTFEGHEHFGFVHRNAIKSVLRGEWITDLGHSLGENFLRHPFGKQILRSTYGYRPLITGELSEEEVEQVLGQRK